MKVGAAIDRLTEDAIGRLIDDFYTKFRADAELGSIFARAIPGDRDAPVATVRNSWSSAMLTSGRYKGNPLAAHRQVDDTEFELFERWLALLDETCRELFVPDIADLFHGAERTPRASSSRCSIGLATRGLAAESLSGERGFARRGGSDEDNRIY